MPSQSMFYRLHSQESDQESRVVDLPNGQVVFFPSGTDGRAYYVRDEEHGRQLDRRLDWVRHAANVAGLAVVLAVAWLDYYKLLIFLVPAMLAPMLAEFVIARRLQEVTDPVAIRNAGIQRPKASLFAPLTVLVAIGAAIYFFGDRLSWHTSVQAIVGVCAVMLVIVQWLRRERLRRERAFFHVSQAPDNKPIEPR